MKKRLFVALLAAVLLITACVPSIKKDLDKAEDLVKDEEYKDAIKIYEKILDKDETQYEAWNGLVEVYIEDKEYKDADEVLEDYFKVVKDEYEEDEDIDYDDLLKEIQDYGKDILDEDEEVGDWYEELNPPMIDLSEINPNHSIDEPLELDVPKDVDVYYTLDGSKVSDKDDKYKKKGIEFEEAGDVVLTVVAINEFGIKGEKNSIELFISEGDSNSGEEENDNHEDMARKLIPSLEPGTYDGPIIIDFTGYDAEAMDLYYTIDDSNPINYGAYYTPELGIELLVGDYKVRVSYYDYENDTYSEEEVFEYTINYNNPDAMSESVEFVIGVYDTRDIFLDYTISDALYRLMKLDPNINVSVVTEDSLEELALALESGEIDAYYGPSRNVEDLAKLGLIMPIGNIITSDYTYYNYAENAGIYNGDYYTMPVTIQSELQLYYDYYDVDDTKIDTWAEFLGRIDNTSNNYDFLLSEDTIGKFLYGLYLSFGGLYEIGPDGQFILGENEIALAIDGVQALSMSTDGRDRVIDQSDYVNTIADGEVTFVLADMWDMYDIDGFINYVSTGSMPLPFGVDLASVNSVQGLHLNSQISGDLNKIKLANMIYEELATEDGVGGLAGGVEALPAIKGIISPDELWLYGTFADYEKLIENNITIPTNNQLKDVYANMAYYYKEVISGKKTSSEAAKAIISGVVDYDLGQ